MFGADRAPVCLRPNTVSIVAGPGGERRMARRLSALPAASRTGKRGAPEDAPREVHPREGLRPARSCWTPRLRNTFSNTFRAVIRVPVRQKLIMSGNVRFSTGRIPQSRFGVVLAAQTRRPCTQRLAVAYPLPPMPGVTSKPMQRLPSSFSSKSGRIGEPVAGERGKFRLHPRRWPVAGNRLAPGCHIC